MESSRPEISLQRQVLFWSGGALVLLAILLVLKDVLLPFVAGFALAYLLDPLADRLTKLGIGRTWAALIILVGFTILLIVIFATLAPLLAEQFNQLMRDLPGYIDRIQVVVTEQLGWLRGMMGGQLPDVQGSVGEIVSQGASWVMTALGGLLAGGSA